MKVTGIGFMVLSTLCFAVVNVCVKFLHHIPAHELVFFRSLISLSISAIMVKHAGIPFFGNNKKWLLGRGLFGSTALFLFFITLKELPLAIATTVQYLSPISTILFATFLLKEKVKPIQWVLFVIAFCGVLMMKGLDNTVSWIYLGLGLLSAVLSGMAYNCIMKCRDTDKPVTVVMYFPLVATPVMGVLCLYHWETPVGLDWLLIITMGVVTQIAQLTMTKALHTEHSHRVMPFKYLGSVYAIMIGYFVFDEVLGWLSLAGILVVLSVILINSRLANRLRG